MNRKTWRDTTPGASHAPAARRIAFTILIVVVFLGAALSATCQLAVAQGGQDLAYSDVLLQTGSGHIQGPIVQLPGSFNLNNLMGANRFYNAGFTGTNAVMANIEAGHIWSGHETLTHVANIPTYGAAGEFDRHATWVGMVMGGRPGGANPGDYQRGMAPNAQLASGAIATSWPFNNPSFPRYTTAFFLDYFGISLYGPYRDAFINGVPAGPGSRRADVVNSSWVGGSDPTGMDNLSGTLDALINENPRTLLTLAAGNSLTGAQNPNKVGPPASGYNNMSVAALGPNGGLYNLPSFFSNSGPNDYYDPQNGTVSQARQVIDIAAPGESFGSAYYGGQTGGNGPNVFGPANDPAGGPNWYSRNVNGTSFAAPTVAGGAALLYDAAYALLGAAPDARDSRVMKAVLMNSAFKTSGWNNGQAANPNGFGGVVTTRGLDNRVGAGRMDLNHAFDQLLMGTTDVLGTTQGSLGNVSKLGWDFGQVNQGTTNDYLITLPLQLGDVFTATLTWFRDRQQAGTTSYTDASYDNLDLELWNAIGGLPVNLISASNGRYNNTEHFTFAIPAASQYMLRVRWTEEMFDFVGDLNIEHYGLAWSTTNVPEPAALLMALLAMPYFACARRRAGR
jgi:hypothetical protein